MKKTILLMLALWLTIAATDAWGDNVTYSYKGVKYTYLSSDNYTSFFNTSVHTPEDYGWYPDSKGWYVNAEKDYITMAEADPDGIPENGEVYLINDLVGYFKSHTHLGGIVDGAFKGLSGLQRVYFQDCDATSYTANTRPYLFIGDQAFANCENLTEINLMQWVTSGTNHWEVMGADNVKRIWGSMLNGSPQAWIRVATSVYQDYLGSSTWTELRDRITTFEHSSDDISVEGVTYSFLKAEDGSALSNADDQHDEIMKTLRLWNADYQQFNAASLLSDKSVTPDQANLWYTTVKGCDASYLQSHNGVARIYNAPGSYYNYKTIAIRSGAFAGCDDLQAVEFWQTNGRSENSYSDPKMVIENGAFKDCKNLKEIRLFYYAQDGTDRWQILDPTDVIPGDNIFGEPTIEELAAMSKEEQEAYQTSQVRILVSPDYYQAFLADPNWVKYSRQLVAADYMPTARKPITLEGLTYDYSANPSGILNTDQVVRQSVSWWTAPIIAAEALIMYYTLGGWEGIKNILSGSVTEYAEACYFNHFIQTSLMERGSEGTARYLMTQPTLVDLFYRYGQEWASGALEERIEQYGTNMVIKYVADYMWEYAGAGAFYAITVSDILTSTGIRVAAYNVLNACMGEAYMAWQGVGYTNFEKFSRGMKSNIIANMHQVGMISKVVTTPTKDLVYHTYLQSVGDDVTAAKIYTSPGSEERTVAIRKEAFQNKTRVETVTIHENADVNSHEMTGLCMAIADSAFVGCTSLRSLDLRLHTKENGIRALGPEHFILCGDSIFAGLDSTKFQIIVAEERLQDFQDDEMWGKLKRYFTTATTEAKVQHTEFGVKYAYAYDGGTQKVSKYLGHKIEHLIAVGADDDYITKNKGAMGFFNDIGSYNNYQLDYAARKAFRGNQNVKTVSFWDVAGWLWTGDAYTDLQMTLQDSCFADCPNLEYVDMIYLRTDGINEAEPMQPSVVRLGKGVFDGSPNVRFRMTEQQKKWFEADTTWVKLKDRFVPCLFKPADAVVLSKLKDLKYQNDVARPWYDNNAKKWGDWYDATLLPSADFFNGKFSGNTDLRTFPDFKRFEAAGLNYVGGSWFAGCSNLSCIELPSTIKTIQGYAFQKCSALKEITIPAAVELIQEYAFSGSGLETIHSLGTTPARLEEASLSSGHLQKIYVPAGSVEAYKTAWPDYAEYIVSEGDYKPLVKVNVKTPGTLANELGLTMVMDGNDLRRVDGNYVKYDSLVVFGTLNGLDLGVLRHLMGADAWDSDPTDGRLRYLNLYYAKLQKDLTYSYNKWGVDEFLEKDNWIGEYVFHNCTALETVILPASVTEIGENTFQNAANLKRIFVGNKTTKYTRDLLQNLKGIEELVFYTDQFATSESSDPWEASIGAVYTRKSQFGQYSNDPALVQRTNYFNAPFEDDEVLNCLVWRDFYFPSQWQGITTTKSPNPDNSYDNGNGYIFYRNRQLKTFDEFSQFTGITSLDYDFQNCVRLERISLPDSLKSIGRYAFDGCESLASITIKADSVPQLARDAFASLPWDFKIYVPKTHVKLYREKWAQYADHIVGEDEVDSDDVIEVTLTEANTLGEKLGLKVTVSTDWLGRHYVSGIEGATLHIKALKVSGPISGGDLSIMRHLAGYSPWGDCRNYTAPLEYIDLYDANLVKSDYRVAIDKLSTRTDQVDSTDVIPAFAFLQCYNLKTLILPRTCKLVRSRAMQQCEYLETLVVGDDCEEFNWDALDDCASMTRMYILARKKLDISTEFFAWRWMCNNYNPTFDAFYVRPSLYKEYINDQAYVGSSWQRTNNISVGAFADDESFAAFGSHAAATQDDLSQVGDVSGWFKSHPEIPDLTALQYTQIDSLRAADIQPLTKLKYVTLPASLQHVDAATFANAAGLRYVDMSQSEDYAPTLAANGGVRSLGITEQTLSFVPSTYGESSDVNVAVQQAPGAMQYNAQTIRIYDGEDYYMPHDVVAATVENTRTLTKSTAPYTVCLPYTMAIPEGAKVYRLEGRYSNELVFTQTDRSTMDAGQPYLVRAAQGDVSLNAAAQTMLATDDQLWAGQEAVSGYTLRSTLSSIGNEEAVELGAYILQDDGKWHAVLSDTEEHRQATIPAYRCYLLQSRQGSRAATIGMTLEDTTGIDRLCTIDSDGTERVYDLSGRLVDGNAKGIVIKNGRKVVNK